MIDCDERPGHPPDRRVCGDRRPRRAAGGPPTEAFRRRAGHAGGGTGTAGTRGRAPLDPVRPLPAGTPVSLPAPPARLPQAADRRGTPAGRRDQPPGPGQPVVVRPAAAARRHPPALRGLSADGQRSQLAGIAGYGYCAAHTRSSWGLKLYLLTAGDGMPITWCLADPKIGEREACLDLLTIAVETGLLPPGPAVLADKGLAGRAIEAQTPAWDHLVAPGPPRRAGPPRCPRPGPGSGSSRSPAASPASSAWNATGGAPRAGCAPASPSVCSPWPPASGTAGPPTRSTSAASSPTTTEHPHHGIDHRGDRLGTALSRRSKRSGRVEPTPTDRLSCTGRPARPR